MYRRPSFGMGPSSALFALTTRKQVKCGSEKTFSVGAVLIPNGVFRQVNGYSNDYWGYEREDTDLRHRFLAEPGRRKGTFGPIHHDSRGFSPDGSRSNDFVRNRRVFSAKWASGKMHDGLSTLDYDILQRSKLLDTPAEPQAVWELVVVQLALDPSSIDEMASQGS